MKLFFTLVTLNTLKLIKHAFTRENRLYYKSYLMISCDVFKIHFRGKLSRRRQPSFELTFNDEQNSEKNYKETFYFGVS